ncbi:FkbM family methyltransferase [Candidatus Parcubacteria bacterium]|nr:FkbM family methyltransferase [Candidatus Parcubacteria bacterium]
MISRVLGYFSYLQKLLGFRAALTFFVYYIFYKSGVAHRSKWCRIPLGQIVFYSPSLKQFAGLFNEIFFKGYYHLEKTNLPIEVIDCGANIGVSLLYIKLMAPHAHVICFEPNPASFAALNKNIKANHWEKEVVAYPYALGKNKGTSDFFVERQEETSYSASLSKHMAGKHELVSFPVRVDLLSSYINKPVDFLKIDIEGAEFDVLEDLFERHKLADISEIQLEYHYHPASLHKSLKEIVTFLESSDFAVSVKDTAKSNSVNHDAISAHMVFAKRRK